MDLHRYLKQVETSWQKLLDEKKMPDFSLNDPWPFFLDWLDMDKESANLGISVFVLRLFDYNPPHNFRIIKTDYGDFLEDVLSGVISRCCEKADLFGRFSSSNFRGWIATVSTNWIWSWLRKKSKERNIFVPSDPHNSEKHKDKKKRIDDCLSDKDKQRVWHCFYQLNSNCQLILAQRFIHEMSNRDIAKELGVSNKKIGNRVYECLQKLKKLIKKAGFRRNYSNLLSD